MTVGAGPGHQAGPVAVPQVDGGLVAAGQRRDGVGQALQRLGQVGQPGELLAEGQKGPGGRVAAPGVAQDDQHVEEVGGLTGEKAEDPQVVRGGGRRPGTRTRPAGRSGAGRGDVDDHL